MKNLLNEENEILINELDRIYSQESHDLVNAVAHDIKNPLGIIDLSLGLLEDKIEQILQNVDEDQAEKIRKFLSNINHSIERCQIILDDTISIRSINTSSEIDEFDFKDFFDEFYIFAKPNLKRAKLSLDNKIPENLDVKLNKQACAKLLILFLKITSEKCAPNNSAVLEISFENDLLQLKIYSRTNEIIELKEDTQTFYFYEYNLNNLCQKLGNKYDISKVDNSIIATLTWPKF